MFMGGCYYNEQNRETNINLENEAPRSTTTEQSDHEQNKYITREDRMQDIPGPSPSFQKTLHNQRHNAHTNARPYLQNITIF